jgi:hypothetical protein
MPWVEDNKENKIKLAISNRLFVNRWLLRRYLTNQLTKDIQLWKEGDKIVGIGHVHYNGTICVFVRKQYRRKGIGSIIVSKMNNSHSSLKAYCGIKGSIEFYKSNGLNVAY